MKGNGPGDGLDFARDLVPLVRSWLRDGVSPSNLASSVRIEALNLLTGGLKADVVGHLEVTVQAVVKLGDAELLAHEELMTAVNARNEKARKKNRRLQKSVFPEVMRVDVLRHACEHDGKHLMLMQALVGFRSLEEELYQNADAGHEELWNGLATAIAMTEVIHGVDPQTPELSRFPTDTNPFSDRIRQKLGAISAADPALEAMWDAPGRVMGTPIPPLNEVLAQVDQWLAGHPPAQARLVHGDCHLGNIMWRKRGENRSIRLIDPNPTIGFTDVSYDWGKLAHFLDTVGWVRHRPEECRAEWSAGASSWTLEAAFDAAGAPREAVRSSLLEALTGFLAQTRADKDPEWRRRYLISIAAAHLGLASMLAAGPDESRRRFVLAHALRPLAELVQGLRS